MQDILKKNQRMVNASGAAVVSLLLIGTAVFGVLPLYRHGAESIRAKAAMEEQLKSFTGLSQTLAQVEASKTATEARLHDVEKRLPSSLEPSIFNDELTEVAKNAGIRLEAMSPRGKLEEAEGYKSMPFEIVGTGDWESCYKFLTGIRAMNRLTRLDSMTIESDKQGQTLDLDKPLCRISVTCSTFFMER